MGQKQFSAARRRRLLANVGDQLVGGLAVHTLGWRAMLKIKHVPFQLFDVTVTPIMFTLLFTFVFGGALAILLQSFWLGLIATLIVAVQAIILDKQNAGHTATFSTSATCALTRARPPLS